MNGLPRTLLFALGFALMLASLSAVIWRQSRALEAQRAAEALRDETALLEAQKAQLARRIQQLEARGRVVDVAGERLGMRVPTSEEIVLLPASRAVETTPGAGAR